MTPVVVCDEYVSYCADSFETFYKGLIPLVDERNGFCLYFDRGKRQKSRALRYYVDLADLAGSDKKARLSDWLRHIIDKRLFEGNAVDFPGHVPSHKHSFFLALRRACDASARAFVARDAVYRSKADLSEAEFILGIADAIALIQNGRPDDVQVDGSGGALGNHLTVEAIYMINIENIGDRIEASGHATLVNRSSVTDSFKSLDIEGRKDDVRHLAAVMDRVLESEDKRVHDLFSGLSEQVAKGANGNVVVGKAIWDALKNALELVKTAASASTALGDAVKYWDKFFG